MSIRRVSDLPSIEQDEFKLSNINDSFLELSYLSAIEDEKYKYASRKIKFRELISAVHNLNNYNVDLCGNIYINKDVSEDNQYKFGVYSNNIEFDAINPINFGESGKIYSLSVINDPIEEQEAVNLKTLTKKLQDLKDYIDNKLSQQNGSIPLLSFVQTDHEVNNDSWVMQGEYILLSERPLLNNYWGEISSSIKTEPDTEDDTWFYHINGDQIILPHTNGYLKFTNNIISAGHYIPQSLPNIKGGVISKKSNSYDTEPLTFADKVTNDVNSALVLEDRKGGSTYGVTGKLGTAYRKLSFNANNHNKIYQDDADVEVKSNCMLLYFYVGPKVQK